MFSVSAPFPSCGPDSVPEKASPEGQDSEDMIVFSQMLPLIPLLNYNKPHAAPGEAHRAPRHSFSDATGTWTSLF